MKIGFTQNLLASTPWRALTSALCKPASHQGGEAAATAHIPAIRDRVLNSADAREGIQSFVERRAAVFQGK